MTDDNITPEEQFDAAESSAASGDESIENAEISIGDPSLAAITTERDTYREIAQRLQADFENFKKRTAKSDQDRIARAEENLVNSLLPVLDAIDLAIAHEPENQSVKQIQSSLLDVLQKAGLKRVGEVNEAFDPNMHEAVMHEEGEGDHHILEIFRAGYTWKGRVIRPAMVKVAGA